MIFSFPASKRRSLVGTDFCDVHLQKLYVFEKSCTGVQLYVSVRFYPRYIEKNRNYAIFATPPRACGGVAPTVHFCTFLYTFSADFVELYSFAYIFS